MSTTLQQATAAPRIARVGDREFRVAPLTLKQVAEYQAWCKDQYMADIRRFIEPLSAEDRKTVLTIATDRIGTMTMTSPEMMNVQSGYEGTFRYVALGLAKYHPDVTADEVAELIENELYRKALLKAAEDANDTSNLPKSPAPAGGQISEPTATPTGARRSESSPIDGTGTPTPSPA